jgi:ABC-2 type transport system ATP-binding protein
MQHPGPAIVLDGLSRDFDSIHAVDGLSLEVPRGGIFGFLGPNGAGKTTTISLLLGLLEPSGGRAQVLGLDPWSQGEDVRQQTGAVLEHTGVYEALTAEDNLVFYARAWRMNPDDGRARIREVLEGMDLWDRRRDKAGTWSRGMQQRLALARALLHRPPLVFLDEPTAGLDVMAATAVREDLARMAADGTTIFLTTHNMAEAERLCGQVAVIRGGRLMALGTPDELRVATGAPRLDIVGRGFGEPLLARLRSLPEVRAVARENGHLTVELIPPAEPAPLIELMVRSGAEIDEVRRGRASLEEVFVTLMEEDR